MTFFDFKSFVHIGHNSSISKRKGMANAQWTNDLFTTHGFLTKRRIQQMCSELSRPISCPNLLVFRSISLHGLRSTHLSGKSPRHRDLSSSHGTKTLSCRHPRLRLPKHLGRCQREKGLANLCGFCSWVDSYGPSALRRRRLRPRTRTDGLRPGFYNYRPLSFPLSLGTLSQTQGSDQIAYPDGLAGQYPLFYLHYQRNHPRCHHPRPADDRTGYFLYHGSRIYRFWPLVWLQSTYGLFRDSCQEKSRLHTTLLSPSRSFHWLEKRSNDSPSRTQVIPVLARSFKKDQLLRCRNKSPVRISDQQLCSSSPDHCASFQVSLASRALLQMDQTKSTNQSFLWDFPECSEDPNLGCYLRLCARRYHQKETQHQSLSQRNLANSQHYPFRKCTVITNTYRFPISKSKGAVF